MDRQLESTSSVKNYMNEKEFDEVKDKLDKANFSNKKNTEDIEKLLVKNCSLAEEMEKKEADIHDLKKRLSTTCQNS